MVTSSKKWIKDPSANLYYMFDFAQSTNGNGYGDDYLDDGEQLIFTGEYPLFTTDGTISVSNVSLQNNNTQVRFMVTGGDAPSECNISCRIKTTLNQVDEFTKVIIIKET